MQVSEYSQQLLELITQAKHISLITSQQPTSDQVHTLLAWYEILTGNGKHVEMYAPQLRRGQFASLKVIEKVSDALPGRRAIVKVSLSNTAIRKINYEVKPEALYLYITPKNGMITTDDVSVSADALHTDLLITIGVSTPELIGQWPADWPQKIAGDIALVNIDTNHENSRYAKLNIVNSTFVSHTLLSLSLLKEMGLPIEGAAAQHLYQGIVVVTKGFTQNLTADVFEFAALLLRNGADATVPPTGYAGVE